MENGHSIHQMTSQEVPLFSFGAIADIQYADLEDRMNFHKTAVRRYRNGLNVLDQAVDYWNQLHPSPVKVTLQLGDIIDGYNNKLPQLDQTDALNKVLETLSKFNGYIGHIWGNHEGLCFRRSSLVQGPLCSEKYQVPNKEAGYYAWSPHEKLCFIILDTFEFSMVGYSKEDPISQQAAKLLQEKNPNVPRDWNAAEGLEDHLKRYVQFNGGVSQTQLDWLDQTLKQAEVNEQIVVISGHQPIHMKASHPKYVSWSSDDILQVIHRYSCVAAYLAGHHHPGGYHQDTHGVHHITLPGVVEGDIGVCDFATFDVYQDRLELKGNGRVPSRTLEL